MQLVYDCQGRLGFSFVTLPNGLPGPYDLYFVDGEFLVSAGTNKDKYTLQPDGFWFHATTHEFFLDDEWSALIEPHFISWLENPLISGTVVCEDFYTYMDERRKGSNNDN